MNKNICILNKNVVCRGIQICTTKKTICCDELDDIMYETVVEIVNVIDDLLEKPLHTILPSSLFERGIRILSYAANVCPTEHLEQKEVMLMLTAFINDYRRSRISDKEDVLFNDFLTLLKYLKNWFKVYYLDYNYSETNLIDNIIATIFHMTSILHNTNDDSVHENYLF